MKKTLLNQEYLRDSAQYPVEWIAIDQIETIAVSSEDPAAPIENVFDVNNEIGWRASEQGEQQIRITFREPIVLRRIQLEFVEHASERTQEFVIRWSAALDGRREDIVRQRWNFSPQGSTREREEYSVNLDGVSLLELLIKPDISGPAGIATLSHFRMA
jgi:hypothetical protein